MSDKKEADLQCERRQLLEMLGWTAPIAGHDDNFWFREGNGPVHDADVWLFAIAEVGSLIIDKVDSLRAVNAHDALAEAARAALPYMESFKAAEHMTEGFGPTTVKPIDAVVDRLRTAIAAAGE